MRRVFPLRPAEANVLIAYQNGAFEPQTANDLAIKSQMRTLTAPCPDESNSLIAAHSSRKEEEVCCDHYPVFNGGYCSPSRSPLSVGSCRDSSGFSNKAHDDVVHCAEKEPSPSAFFSAISSSLSSHSTSRNESGCSANASHLIIDGERFSTRKQKLNEPFTVPVSSSSRPLQREAASVSRSISAGAQFLPFSNEVLSRSSPISESLRKHPLESEVKSKSFFALSRFHSFLRYFTACVLVRKSAVKLVRNQNHAVSSKSTSTEIADSGRYELYSDENSCSGGFEFQCDTQPRELKHYPVKCLSFRNVSTSAHIQRKADVLRSFERAASFHCDADSGSALVSHVKPKALDTNRNVQQSHGPHSKASWRDQEVYDDQFESLKHEVIKLWKDKRQLVLELLSEVKSHMSERSAAEISQKCMQSRMQDQLRSLEREHDCVRGHLEKELERREKEWDRRLHRAQTQERKLKERIIHLVDEKSNLERDVSSYRSREALLQSQTRDCEIALQSGLERCRKSEEEVVQLKQELETALIQLREKEREIEIARHQTKTMEVEKRDLLREFCRLRRATEEQNITFEELSKVLVDLVNCPPGIKEQVLAEVHRDLRRLAIKEVALLNEIGCLRSELSLIKHTTRIDCKKNGMVASKAEECSSTANLASVLSIACEENEPSKDEICELEKLLSLANRQVTELEHEINAKNRELNLQQLNLQKSNWELSELQRELNWTKMQRDGFSRKAECKNEECMKLNLEVTNLKRMVEKLDEEVMLKEGEISILRESYISDSEF